MTLQKYLSAGAMAFLVALFVIGGTAIAADESKLPDKMEKPEGFPARPMTVICPYGPAGGSCTFARALAQAFTEVTGVTINVEYKPGGSGLVGLKTYMSAPPDGYTVLEHIDDAASAYAAGQSNVHPANDLIPLVTAQITFNQIFMRADETRFSDWASFVEYAKKQNAEGKKPTIANVSRQGSMERVVLQLALEPSGIQLQQVSFDKGSQRYASLKGGQVDVMLEQPGDVRGFIESGDFKPILTLLKEKPEAFPDAPSMKEAGLHFEPLLRYRGFYVHKDTPEDRVKWLQWAFQKAYYQESFQKFNEQKYMNLIPSFRDTEGSKQVINSAIDIYKKVYKEIGLIK